MVEFPLFGFDMSPHVASRPEGGSVPNGVGWSPWKRPRRQSSARDDNVYDLYAVCNHHGQDVQGGHYTGEFPPALIFFFVSNKIFPKIITFLNMHFLVQSLPMG
jgi:hypothetical protein